MESIHAGAKLCICVSVPVGWGDAIAIIYCIVLSFVAENGILISVFCCTRKLEVYTCVRLSICPF